MVPSVASHVYVRFLFVGFKHLYHRMLFIHESLGSVYVGSDNASSFFLRVLHLMVQNLWSHQLLVTITVIILKVSFLAWSSSL